VPHSETPRDAAKVLRSAEKSVQEGDRGAVASLDYVKHKEAVLF
jgi:hypothetical protein